MILHIGSMTIHLVSAPVSRLNTILEPTHLWSQCPLVNGVRRWQLNIKPNFTHLFHVRTLGVCPSVQVPHRRGHRCGTDPLLEQGSPCEWCMKLAIDYKT